jgi:hypothetical protein
MHVIHLKSPHLPILAHNSQSACVIVPVHTERKVRVRTGPVVVEPYEAGMVRIVAVEMRGGQAETGRDSVEDLQAEALHCREPVLHGGPAGKYQLGLELERGF